MNPLDSFDKKQLHLITWAQTGLIAVMMGLISVLAGFWCKSMKDGQERLIMKFDVLCQSISDLKVSDARQQAQIDAILRPWSARTDRNHLDPAPIQP